MGISVPFTTLQFAAIGKMDVRAPLVKKSVHAGTTISVMKRKLWQQVLQEQVLNLVKIVYAEDQQLHDPVPTVQLQWTIQPNLKHVSR